MPAPLSLAKFLATVEFSIRSVPIESVAASFAIAPPLRLIHTWCRDVFDRFRIERIDHLRRVGDHFTRVVHDLAACQNRNSAHGRILTAAPLAAAFPEKSEFLISTRPDFGGFKGAVAHS